MRGNKHLCAVQNECTKWRYVETWERKATFNLASLHALLRFYQLIIQVLTYK